MRQPGIGVRKSPYLGHIYHWNSHTRDNPRCQEEVCNEFLPRFTRLRSQQAFEQGQKHTSTCSTRPDLTRVRPAPDPAHPAPRQAKPVPLPAPIKPAEASTIRPLSLSTSLERQITGICSMHGVLVAARDPDVCHALAWFLSRGGQRDKPNLASANLPT